MRPLLILGAPLAALLALTVGVVVVIAPAGGPLSSMAAAASCPAQLPDAVSAVHLDGQQRQVADTVIAVGQSLGVPARGWVVALAAGLTESGLRPLPYGDRDSVGVFQQRTAWGTLAQRMNPRTAARMFFTGGHGGQRGLLDIAGWQQLPVTAAAQAVQVSAYPDAYAKWAPLATRLVDSLGHAPGGTTDVATGCSHTQAQSGGWVFPLGGAHYVRTSGFGSCGRLWAHCHTGQDFAVPTGTPVQAAGAGVVVFAGWGGAYGNLVEILHAGGVATWYAHLSRLETRRGARVAAGQVIGLSGATGNTTGPHLHFEVRLHATGASDGTPVDPMGWLHAHHLS